MSTHNIRLYEDLTKIIIQLSSNTHLISSSETHYVSNLCNIHVLRHDMINVACIIVHKKAQTIASRLFSTFCSVPLLFALYIFCNVT